LRGKDDYTGLMYVKPFFPRTFLIGKLRDFPIKSSKAFKGSPTFGINEDALFY